MCAINGIFAYHYAAPAVNCREVMRTRDHMAARGPDGCGAWFAADGRIGFGHRRLAVTDLSERGAQPMIADKGRRVITHNGEIYNHVELRRWLETSGCRFRSRCDAEVLLRLYAVDGAAMVDKLRGMFAFAIWDGDRERLLLARDRFGIKPLYYVDDGWCFRFASQVKALLAGGAVSRDPCPEGQSGFYTWGAVPEPATIYRDIRALPAGSTAIVDRLGLHRPRSYYSVASVVRDGVSKARSRRCRPSHAELRSALRAALRESVQLHSVADVPVGAFLSAGVDSGVLVGLMQEVNGAQTDAVTISPDEFQGRMQDEAPLAARVARKFGARHHTRVVIRREFHQDIERLLQAMDQPSIDGVNCWFAAKAAREQALKVMVSGIGADELLGGYPLFHTIPRYAQCLAPVSLLPPVGRVLAALIRPLRRGVRIHPKAAGMILMAAAVPGGYLLHRGLFLPWELKGLLRDHGLEPMMTASSIIRDIRQAIDLEPSDDFGKMVVLEMCLYLRNQLLRDADWAGMAHGVEVRTPYVDHVVLEALAPFMATRIFRDAKRALATVTSPALPDEIAARTKTGFALPYPQWCLGNRIGRRHKQGDLSPWPALWARQWAHDVGCRYSGATKVL